MLNSDNIQKMFSDISHNYDKANALITFGMHSKWRKKVVELSDVKPGDIIFDCATGTGDLAFEFKKKLKHQLQVIACDFCPNMLNIAKQKSSELNLEVKFEQLDALNLHYKDNYFDIVCVAYGIRNMASTQNFIKEVSRVLKSGGIFIILETGQSNMPFYGALSKCYFRYIVPLLGFIITGNLKAYSYLQKSANTFPYGNEFVKLLNNSEMFNNAQSHCLMGGVSYIYKACKK